MKCTHPSPPGATGTVAENAAVNTVIYTASATDTDFAPGTQSLTYSLSGTDAALLNIDAATGAVTLKASADFETKDSYFFSIVAKDAAGNSGSRTCWLALPTWMKWRPLSLRCNWHGGRKCCCQHHHLRGNGR
jgi:hypothetical protein